MHQFQMTFKPSEQFLRDVLCTAIEGGSGYWASFSNFVFARGEHGREYIGCHINEFGDSDKRIASHTVDIAAMLEGVHRCVCGDMTDSADHAQLSHHNRAILFQALISEEGGDAGQVDADLADCILQAAALGRIVYG